MRNLVASLAPAGRFEFITLKEAGAHPRLGAWPPEKWKGNFHLISEDAVLTGEAAIPEILRHLRGGRLAAWVLDRAPGGRWLTGRLYRWVALNRERWGRHG